MKSEIGDIGFNGMGLAFHAKSFPWEASSGIKALVSSCLLNTEYDKILNLGFNLSEEFKTTDFKGNLNSLPELYNLGEFDAVVADAFINCLILPNQASVLFSKIAQVTKPGSKFIFRCCVSNENDESIEDVLNDAYAKRISDFDIFKFNFSKAVANDCGQPNIRLSEVLSAFSEYVSDLEYFSKESGFELSAIKDFIKCENDELIYSFPTLEELLASLPEQWQFSEVIYSDDDARKISPLVILERRISDIVWPAMPLSDYRKVDLVLNAIYKIQTFPREKLEALQLLQLRAVTSFAYKYSPFIKERMDNCGISSKGIATIEDLRRMPLMTRFDLQGNKDRLDCSQYAIGHGPFESTKTSGSSGVPVEIKRSTVLQSYWLAFSMREHLWHRRDFRCKLAALRARVGNNSRIEMPNWGPPASLFTQTGRGYSMPVNESIDKQVEWINEINPEYLLVYPTDLSCLLDEAEEGKMRMPAVRQIRTIGETVTQELRERVEHVLGARLVDIYSSQELGVIASECQNSGCYHISEGLIVEILNDKGEECKAGEVGKIVVTDLFNYAMPIIRYSIEDYAEAMDDVEICECGCGSKCIKRIYGRERNMLKHPDGSRKWPITGTSQCRKIAPIKQFQLLQKSYEEFEMKLVVDEKLTSEQEEQMRQVICGTMGWQFKMTFTYFNERIPLAASGKFEEFVCQF